MSFIDAENGWLMALVDQNEDSYKISIRQTVDGGASWTQVWTSEVTSSTDEKTYPIQGGGISFVNQQTGWIFDPGLSASSDGGKNWQAIEFKGEVVALATAGPDKPVWAIAQTCPDPNSPNCSLQLFEASPDKPDQWKLLSHIPGEYRLLAFARPDAATGYALMNIGVESFRVGLIATHDGGHSWTTTATPCYSEAPLLAAADVSYLEMICTNMLGAGQAIKPFYTSADRGKTWRLIHNPDEQKNITTYGYPAALLFLSPKVGVLALDRAMLVVTGDGGLSWTDIDSTDEDNGGGWVLVAAGGQDIFAAIRATIYHSRDGGLTWESSEIH
jgi:photosystem II stability/assembly factor-like uncharacterized protein